MLDIHDKEQPGGGVIVSFGGQIPNSLAMPLQRVGVRVLGTSPLDIDRAEDRQKFSEALDAVDVLQPPWCEASDASAAAAFAARVGYPVLVRPSYVLSGAAMNVVRTPAELGAYLGAATSVSPDHPVVVTKFALGARELEIDAVAKNGVMIAHALSEHIEDAGVHSGDATHVLPAQTLGTKLEVKKKF